MEYGNAHKKRIVQYYNWTQKIIKKEINTNNHNNSVAIYYIHGSSNTVCYKAYIVHITVLPVIIMVSNGARSIILYLW